MATYRYISKLQPSYLRSRLSGLAPLREDALVSVLPVGASLLGFDPETASHTVEVEHEPDAEQQIGLRILNAVLVLAENAGYDYLETEIAKVGDRAVEWALGGGIAAGGAGATHNGELALIAGGIVGLLGLLFGSRIEKVEPIYQVRLTQDGWVFVPIPRGTGTGPAIEPAV